MVSASWVTRKCFRTPHGRRRKDRCRSGCPVSASVACPSKQFLLDGAGLTDFSLTTRTQDVRRHPRHDGPGGYRKLLKSSGQSVAALRVCCVEIEIVRQAIFISITRRASPRRTLPRLKEWSAEEPRGGRDNRAETELSALSHASCRRIGRTRQSPERVPPHSPRTPRPSLGGELHFSTFGAFFALNREVSVPTNKAREFRALFFLFAVVGWPELDR